MPVELFWETKRLPNHPLMGPCLSHMLSDNANNIAHNLHRPLAVNCDLLSLYEESECVERTCATARERGVDNARAFRLNQSIGRLY